MIDPLQPGQPVAHNWRTINAVVDGLNRLEVPNQGRDGAIAGLRVRPRDGGGGAGAAVTMMKVQTVPAGKKDYFLARTWDGTTLGEVDIPVAKRPEFRPSLESEVIGGLTINYAWTDDNNRVADDGINDQNEQIYRPFVAGEVLFAVQVTNNTGVIDADDAPVSWVDISSRVWAAY
jgi:hypothetical protein